MPKQTFVGNVKFQISQSVPTDFISNRDPPTLIAEIGVVYEGPRLVRALDSLATPAMPEVESKSNDVARGRRLPRAD